MRGKNILAYDLGTGGNKAVLYSSEGELINKTFVPYDSKYPQPGWAEHDPFDWWNSMVKNTKAENQKQDKGFIILEVINWSIFFAYPY